MNNQNVKDIREAKKLEGKRGQKPLKKGGKIKTVPFKESDLLNPCPPPSLKHAKALKKARVLRGWTQTTAAMVFNVTLNSLQKWEAGQRPLCRSSLRLLQCLDKVYPVRQD